MAETKSLDMSLPPGFVMESWEGGHFAVREEEREVLLQTGIRERGQVWEPGEKAEVSGRGALYRIQLTRGKALVRPYRHGGLLRSLRGDKFGELDRPFAELALGEELREAGIPVADPIAAAALGQEGSWRLYFVSREIKGVDLEGFLRSADVEERMRGITLRRVGLLLQQLHERGVVHADLHPKNLLVEEGRFNVYLLDLDKTERKSSLTRAERVANLARFYRYGKRREYMEGSNFLTEEDFLAILEGYAEGEAGGWKKEIEREFRGGLPLHKLGWGLEKFFGGS